MAGALDELHLQLGVGGFAGRGASASKVGGFGNLVNMACPGPCLECLAPWAGPSGNGRQHLSAYWSLRGPKRGPAKSRALRRPPVRKRESPRPAHLSATGASTPPSPSARGGQDRRRAQPYGPHTGDMLRCLLI